MTVLLVQAQDDATAVVCDVLAGRATATSGPRPDSGGAFLDPPEVMGPRSAPDPLTNIGGVHLGRHVTHFPVMCGATRWGELLVVPDDDAVASEELYRAGALADLVSAALLAARTTAATAGPDELAGIVLDCAEQLEGMPDASTCTRLVLVVRRLATAVGATSWSVGLAHQGLLHVMLDAATDDAGGAHGGQPVPEASSRPGGTVALARFPARRAACEGGVFHADHACGDAAERRQLAVQGHSCVIGSGGYDLDGQSWLVMLTGGPALTHATPVLAALVISALSFPRQATAPRPQEPAVCAVLQPPTPP